MIDRTWFHLLVRGIGILALVLSLPILVYALLQVIDRWPIYRNGQVSWQEVSYTFIPVVAYSLQFALGIYLLFFGRALIRRCLLDALDRCPACQYDLRDIKSDKCPECGTPIVRVDRVLPGD